MALPRLRDRIARQRKEARPIAKKLRPIEPYEYAFDSATVPSWWQRLWRLIRP